MNDTMLTPDVIRWETGALAKIPHGEHRKLFAEELTRVFGAEGVQRITVFDAFVGFLNQPLMKVILGVETVRGEERRSHIVKLGVEGEVGKDLEGWRSCIAQRMVRSRLFVPVRSFDLSGPARGSSAEAPARRQAIVYENGYTLFGHDAQSDLPRPLHEATEEAIKKDDPKALSIERVITEVLIDLQVWFYNEAVCSPERAAEFYAAKLAKVADLWTADPSIPDSDPRASRAVLRADALWLLAGRDKPEEPERYEYLDPLDCLLWALPAARKSPNSGSEPVRVPATLVGPSHGDLHAYNILVGVRRHEATSPVVYDYGDMARDNVLAWDYVKLETELKIRLLPWFFELDPTSRAWLLARSPLAWRRGLAGSIPEADRLHRAERLAWLFQFERQLAICSRRIENEEIAGRSEPPTGRDVFPGCAALNRLFCILMRIRQEAALVMGPRQPDRFRDWLDEYFFGLAVYGLFTAKWSTCKEKHTECALISSGVACAELQQAKSAHQPAAIRAWSSGERPVSHRVPLYVAHAHWKQKDHTAALKILDAARACFPRCTPLRAEQALNLAGSGQITPALKLVQPLRTLCQVFGDYETLTRIGRCLKEMANDRWQQLQSRQLKQGGEPVRQLLESAYWVYLEAYQINHHYFPGVNAASLALLSRQSQQEIDELVRSVSDGCARAEVAVAAEERFWLFATEAELALVQRDYASAAARYVVALQELDTTTVGCAQSAWNQVCLLGHFLGIESLIPVAEAFESLTLIRTNLDVGPFGNCGRPWPNREPLRTLNDQQAWRQARKTKPIWAKRLEQAQTVCTSEGSVEAAAGDYLCRGFAGELWPQRAEKLEAKYAATDVTDADGWRKYEPRPEAEGVLAAPVDHPFSVIGSWGKFTGRAGDYVVKHAADRATRYPDDVWIVAKNLFEATYEWSHGLVETPVERDSP